MKKPTILLIVLGFALVFSPAVAQNSQAEAKAAYLLAEEAFDSNNYESALNYLAQAQKALGKPNSKLLYLKVLIELEQLSAGKVTEDAVLATIRAFESVPDYKVFNSEKVTEVLKAKLKLQEAKAQQAEEEKKKIAQQERLREFDKLIPDFEIRPGYKLGARFDELKKRNDAALFKNKGSRFSGSRSSYINAREYVPSNWNSVLSTWPNEFKAVYEKDGIVKGYKMTVVVEKLKKTTQKDFDKQYVQPMLQQLVSFFNEPTYSEIKQQSEDRFRWESNKYLLILTFDYSNRSYSGLYELIMEVYDKN